MSHITVLKGNGFSNSMIAYNTGHKNAGSIDRYNRKRRDCDFSSMSNALAIETSIGMHGKVRMEEQSLITSAQDHGQQVQPQIKLDFTGTFNNCTFKIEL